MFFLLSKLTFDPDTTAHVHPKETKALIEKLQKRFKICAAASSSPQEDGKMEIVICGLGPIEQKLSAKVDEIAEFCEQSGFGRVDGEQTLLEHCDSLVEED